ncbi:MAG: OsmC family protein [Armatimonadota bacterium]|nr:OsmC family protein [Armatimonadota bacterium]MDR7516229.1 OsmC family protein [Armatimonadota bacterium]MDR7560218.1 OsmC family protein [Armatimonadota bacterium]MDR7589038.1 OsmC family protein [Armatimonadota bacterium]MDR7611805.1 OsmC family protein [Armatimonadota bacterium]
MSEVMRATVRLRQEDGYRFRAEYDSPAQGVVVDEPPPLGGGAGPNPARMLATAVGHCLSSSLLYCLRRARVPDPRVETTVDVEIRRTESGRWRIAGIRAALDLSSVPAAWRAAVERCRELFEDFCIVTASVRRGIPVDVTVRAGEAVVAPAPEPDTRPGSR